MHDATMELSIFRYLEILIQNLDKQVARNRRQIVLHDRGEKDSVLIALLLLLLNQLCYVSKTCMRDALDRDTTL